MNYGKLQYLHVELLNTSSCAQLGFSLHTHAHCMFSQCWFAAHRTASCSLLHRQEQESSSYVWTCGEENKNILAKISSTVADFPDGRAWKTYCFARFLPKTAWKGKKLGREGGCASLAPPGSANALRDISVQTFSWGHWGFHFGLLLKNHLA